MIFGKGPFVCDDCGNKFIAFYAEWCATVAVAPCRCPACGSWHTYPPIGILGKEFYKKIWESMDKKR